MSDTFNAGDIIRKTLVAKRDIPVYAYPGENREPIGKVKAGSPVGVVFSYFAADPFDNRSTLWWGFEPASNYGKYFYAPHKEGFYDIKVLQEQGVLSLEEKQQAEEEANMSWYEKLIKNYGPAVVLTILGAAAIKGYFSRKTS